jgi:acyl-CoA thioester hydrolase
VRSSERPPRPPRPAPSRSTIIKYLRELRGGDRVDVTCAFEWGTGKAFKPAQRIIKEDGTVAAEFAIVGGILDLTTRRLVADPAARLAALADDPGLPGC